MWVAMVRRRRRGHTSSSHRVLGSLLAFKGRGGFIAVPSTSGPGDWRPPSAEKKREREREDGAVMCMLVIYICNYDICFKGRRGF